MTLKREGLLGAGALLLVALSSVGCSDRFQATAGVDAGNGSRGTADRDEDGMPDGGDADSDDERDSGAGVGNTGGNGGAGAGGKPDTGGNGGTASVGDAGAGAAGAGGKGAGAAGAGVGGRGDGGAGAAGAGGMGDGGYAKSCKELHESDPGLTTGEHLIQPDGVAEPFTVHCDMQIDGGGWTLAFNQDESFDPTLPGQGERGCFSENCTNLAYSTVPLELDVMMHTADANIVETNWLAQVIVRGVHIDSRGRTLRALMDAPGRYFMEAEDNSNIELTANAAGDPCDVLRRGFKLMVCDTNVLTFSDVNDNTACTEQESVGHKFAIGGEVSYTEHWYNCAGWPQHAINQGVSEMPRNFRFFVR